MATQRQEFCGADQSSILSKGDVLASLRAQVSLGKAVIDYVYQASILLSLSDQDVLWLEISMEERFGVHLLQSDKELKADVEDSADRELFLTERE